MTNWQLYKLLRQNEKLSDKRHPMFEKNRFVKFLAYFMIVYYASLMIFMGVTLGIGLSDPYTGVPALHVFNGGFFYILIIDFWLRFVLQETPAQRVHQYMLLPIRRKTMMHIYLFRSIISSGNLFWASLLVPFGLVGITPLFGWWAFAGWLLGWWMMFVANSLVYQFVRSLCLKHILWFLPALAIHAGIVCLALLPDHNMLDMPATVFMYSFARQELWPFLAIFAIIIMMYVANFKLQSGMVKKEEAKEEKAENYKESTLSKKINFLNRYGTMGEYMKMELKLRIRNSQVRLQFLICLGMMILLSALMDFTEVYDNGFMTSFICLYDYIVLGMMTLVSVMCYEGNYIDGLMARRESIYELLVAKYYFNSFLLLIPALLIIPSIYLGKITAWMSIGYLLFTIGVIYPFIFQMAVYNNNTIPLNQKITGKQASTAQNIIAMVVMFLPIGFEKAAVILMGDPWGYIFLSALGIIGAATHKIWLRNIYKRFMQRRYVNMEAFRASRQ